jgi:hypothetical protein
MKAIKAAAKAAEEAAACIRGLSISDSSPQLAAAAAAGAGPRFPTDVLARCERVWPAAHAF